MKTPTIEELERRLDRTLSMWPHFREEPEGEKYRLVAMLLLDDPKIWKIVEGKMNARKSGAPRKDAGESKYSLETLVALAEEFENFKRAKRRKDGAQLNKAQLIEKFRPEAESRHGQLPKSTDALDKLIRSGRNARKFPKVPVAGRWRILHPDQFAAYEALQTYPLHSKEDHERALDEILALRVDREGDPEKMAEYRMMHTLRAHGIASVLGLPLFPSLLVKGSSGK
jgi:hypothetical protein